MPFVQLNERVKRDPGSNELGCTKGRHAMLMLKYVQANLH